MSDRLEQLRQNLNGKIQDIPVDAPFTVDMLISVSQALYAERVEADSRIAEAKGEAGVLRMHLARLIESYDQALKARPGVPVDAIRHVFSGIEEARAMVQGVRDPSEMRLTVREAARRRLPLSGPDAQALEGALALTERERDEARTEAERLRAALAKARGEEEA